MATLLVLASLTVAFADDPVYSLTINSAEAGHTYTAYQIFAGTVTNASGTDNTDSKLGSVSWGDGISRDGQTAMLSYGKNSGTWADAAALAESLGTTADDAIAFANAVDDYLVSSAGHTGTYSNGVYTISNLPAGYYIVEDTYDNASSETEGKDYTISRYMVQVVGNATVTNKADKPTIEKKLKNQGELAAAYRDANNVGIDDIVNYRVQANVPNMVDYKQYFFIMHDTLSPGLTLQDENDQGFTVKVGNTTLTRVADASEAATANPSTVYYVKKSADNGSTKIDIVFHNFKQYERQFGQTVEVTYNAKLNEHAVVGTAGNTNEINLEYSNNPSEDGNGKDEPDDGDDVTGTTPSDWTKTYTVNLKLLKVDGSNTTQALQGVVFNVTGYKMNDVVTTYTENYEKFEGNGDAPAAYKYWKLATNPATYTDVAPNSYTSSKYDSTTDKYMLTVTESTETTTNGTEMVNFANQATNENGYIALNKISAGKYVFTEVSTLDGYNLLTAPIVVEIKANTNTGAGATSGTTANLTVTDGTTACVWTATKDGDALTYDTGNFGFEFKVLNNSGAELPETGGIGTTLFYIGGSILVLAAVILLITKRRMSANND